MYIFVCNYYYFFFCYGLYLCDIDERWNSQGSRDNMSIVLLTLPGAPKVSEEAIKKEKEMEDIIEKKVAGK